jgi:hypothetical protein
MAPSYGGFACGCIKIPLSSNFNFSQCVITVNIFSWYNTPWCHTVYGLQRGEEQSGYQLDNACFRTILFVWYYTTMKTVVKISHFLLNNTVCVQFLVCFY